MRTENGLFYLGPCRYLLLNSLPPHPIQIRSHRYNGISLEFIDDRHFLMLVKDSPPDAPGISIHTATLFTRRTEAGSWDISRVRFQAGRGWGPDTSGDGEIDVSANGVIGVRFDRYLSGKSYPLFKDHFAGAGYYHAGTEPSWNYVSEIDAKRLEKQLQSLSNRSGALEQTTRLGKRLMFQRLNDNCVVLPPPPTTLTTRRPPCFIEVRTIVGRPLGFVPFAVVGHIFQEHETPTDSLCPRFWNRCSRIYGPLRRKSRILKKTDSDM